MINAGAVYDALDKYCDFNNQEPWDNSGLLVGDRRNKVTKIMVTLDITADVIEQARVKGAELIVSHHPVIFKPLKRLEPSDCVYMLAKYGIAAICAHTCLDAADNGVNDVLANILELTNVEKVESDETSTLLLRTGYLKSEYTPEDFAEYVGKKLSAKVSLTDGGRKIKKVMLCTGSGGEFFRDAAQHGCEALVTGEAGYHHMLDAQYMGVTIVAAGHFETENPIVDTLKEFFEEKFKGIEVIKAERKVPAKII